MSTGKKGMGMWINSGALLKNLSIGLCMKQLMDDFFKLK